MSSALYGQAQPIRNSCGGRRFVDHMEALDKVVGESGPIEVDINVSWHDVPIEMSAEEPFDGAHEFNIDEVIENTLKLVFHFSDFR